MKKQTSYNNKTNKSILTHMPPKEYFSLLTFYFFTASLCGFLWEVLIFFIKEGHFRTRGFFYGPWLPVYGTGAVLMYLLLSKQKRHPVKVFI